VLLPLIVLAVIAAGCAKVAGSRGWAQQELTDKVLYVKLQKGHTEGYEPNVTDKIIELAVSAKGGKIANGSWEPPPPPPPPARGPFG
jgi:hypothetical protein